MPGGSLDEFLGRVHPVGAPVFPVFVAYSVDEHMSGVGGKFDSAENPQIARCFLQAFKRRLKERRSCSVMTMASRPFLWLPR